MTSDADKTSLDRGSGMREDEEGDTEIDLDRQRAPLAVKDYSFGQVKCIIHKPDLESSICCVTSLNDKIYLLYENKDDKIDVYDATNYRKEPPLTVPGLRGIMDIAACSENRRLYISDRVNKSVHRVNVDPDSGGCHSNACWDVDDTPWALSVTADSTLLVTCPWARKIKEFTTYGEPRRTIEVQDDILHPWHAIQLSSSSRGAQFIVCHGSGALGDPNHRVCIIDALGHIVKSFGGVKGSQTQENLSVPTHLAVDESSKSVYVVDVHNRRIVQLSNDTLEFQRLVLPSTELKWRPRRIHLDAKRRQLYVVDTDEYVSGRVLVVSL